MIPAIIIIAIAFIWLFIETNYMRVRLPPGYRPTSPPEPSGNQGQFLQVASGPAEVIRSWTIPAIDVSTLKVPLIYLGAITAAELIVALVNPLVGVIFQIALGIILIYHASYAANRPENKFYLTLAIAPLIRLVSLFVPLTEFPQVYWYAITAIPIIITSIIVVRRLNYRPFQLGLTLKKLPLQLLVVLTGIPFGIAEFYILRSAPLAGSLAWQELLVPALILLVCTGFVEELVFRGLMQRAAGEAVGWWGWVYVAILFAVLHVGYLSVADFAFVLIVGLFFGWVVQKTGSLFGVTLSHGITNIVLYLIAPFFL